MSELPVRFNSDNQPEALVTLVGFSQCKDRKEFSDLGKRFGSLLVEYLPHRAGRYNNRLIIPNDVVESIGIQPKDFRDTFRSLYSEFRSYHIQLINKATETTTLCSLVSSITLQDNAVEVTFHRGLTKILDELAAHIEPELEHEFSGLELTVKNQSDTLFDL